MMDLLAELGADSTPGEPMCALQVAMSLTGIGRIGDWS
jgi:hypothetical protein